MYILALIFYHQQTSGRHYFVNYFKRDGALYAYPGVKIYFHIKITEIIYIFQNRRGVYDKQDLSALG